MHFVGTATFYLNPFWHAVMEDNSEASILVRIEMTVVITFGFM